MNDRAANPDRSHQSTIRDQFTKQAIPFSSAAVIKDEETLKLLVDATGAGPDDTVLDVACGPGLVVWAFARTVRHATGIDLTPAMIERAQELERQQALRNVTWRVGDILPLPYADTSFSIVTSRFAFHHFPNPGAVLAEMKRVCRPSGKVALVDLLASPDVTKATAFDSMEKLRDPSHVHAFDIDGLRELFSKAGLAPPEVSFYEMKMELEGLLERSFPAQQGDIATIRQIFVDSLVDDRLGLNSRRVGDQIRFVYRAAILVSGT